MVVMMVMMMATLLTVIMALRAGATHEEQFASQTCCSDGYTTENPEALTANDFNSPASPVLHPMLPETYVQFAPTVTRSDFASAP